ncbi:ganglioside gm2 activator [Plakobranchus ocellatus]|uniref:Ganglioside gm2 activator n=1 Tax=Plakobranchus ocellatus TaxID=259542 RepID=A0AAV4AQQ4_9GAST|nr:ganglioside gm2 activator [Plakobranchus ocellatus]
MAYRISCVTRACVVVVLLSTLGYTVTESRRRRGRALLNYADCGSGEDKLIHFHTVEATPIPVVLPGTLYLSMSGNLTSDLPRRVNLYLAVTKYFFGFPFVVPCLSNGVGSCSYENICATLDHYEKHGCPAALQHYGVQCFCPFTAGEFNLVDVPVTIPKVQGFASAILNGDYELQVKLVEEDGPVLGCLRIKFTMKKRSRGWLFKIYRQDKTGQARRSGERKRKRSRRGKRKEGGPSAEVMGQSVESVNRTDLANGGKRYTEVEQRHIDGDQGSINNVGHEKGKEGETRTEFYGNLDEFGNSGIVPRDAPREEVDSNGNDRIYTNLKRKSYLREKRLNKRKNRRKVKKRNRRGHKKRKRKKASSLSMEDNVSKTDIEDLPRTYRVSRGLDGTAASMDKNKEVKRRRKRRRRKRRKEKEMKRRERERLQAEKKRRKNKEQR